MTRRTPPAVQLARDVLHVDRCNRPRPCTDCVSAWPRLHNMPPTLTAVTLARALLRAVKERP